MDRTSAGAPASAASEVDEFMEAMGAGSATQAPATEPAQAPSTAPDASLPPVDAATETYEELDLSNLPMGVAPSSVPEQPVQQEAPVTPPANNSNEELERYRREAETARQAAEAYKQQVDAYNAAMQAEMVRAQQRQTEQQRAERVNQAMQVHQQLIDAGDPERAASYIRSFYDGLLTQTQQAAQAQVANLQVQAQQQQEQLIAPQYAQYLVQTHQLPAEYQGILSQFDGRTQDRILPQLKAQYETQKQQLTQQQTALEQRVRELEAAQRAGSGAYNPGGTNGAAAPMNRPRPSDPREAEVYDYLTAPVLQRQR
jgi:hypothetical protein